MGREKYRGISLNSMGVSSSRYDKGERTEGREKRGERESRWWEVSVGLEISKVRDIHV